MFLHRFSQLSVFFLSLTHGLPLLEEPTPSLHRLLLIICSTGNQQGNFSDPFLSISFFTASASFFVLFLVSTTRGLPVVS
jgi:hypothetical protein